MTKKIDIWTRIIEKDNKREAEIERAIQRVERAHDKADRKTENRAIHRFERIADRELGILDKEKFW